MAARTYIVSRAEAGRTVADWLRTRLGLAPADVRHWLRERRVLLAGLPCPDPFRRLQRGQRLEIHSLPPLKKSSPSKEDAPRASTSQPRLVYADDHIVVVDKPPGMTTMRHAEDVAEFGRRARRFLPPTLADLIPGMLAKGRDGRPAPVRAVHRIDNETSGLVVFARAADAERRLSEQFRAHSTDRLYLALVRGQARDGRIESILVRDRGDGRRGSTNAPQPGVQRAVTYVRVLEALGEYSFVECRLETGRTHQVRIHLGEAGTPLCGERVYDRPLHGRPFPDGSGAKRAMLHAATLGFDHPATGERVRWTSSPPGDMRNLLQELIRRAPKPPRDNDESII
jgi:23S rRNA pseudouridine1911/1915/1917 synthase